MIKMELFALLRNHFVASGISVSENSSKSQPFNVKNSTVFVLLCLTVSLMGASITEANSFDERTDICFKSVSIGLCCIVYVMIVWKTSILFEFIDNLDETINESE